MCITKTHQNKDCLKRKFCFSSFLWFCFADICIQRTDYQFVSIVVEVQHIPKHPLKFRNKTIKISSPEAAPIKELLQLMYVDLILGFRNVLDKDKSLDCYDLLRSSLKRFGSEFIDFPYKVLIKFLFYFDISTLSFENFDSKIKLCNSFWFL